MATEKRLIDANALMFEPDPWGGANGVLIAGRSGGKMMATVLRSLKCMVDKAPTVDAVEVVRCKDCKWYEIAEDYVPYCRHESGYCGEHMGGLFYCAMGERKDNNEG